MNSEYRDLRISLINLQDAFLSASLMRKYMKSEPVPDDPEQWHTSDRARFERLWVAFLAVLVEAWQSNGHRATREYVASVVPTETVERLIKTGEKDGTLAKMRETRHYMFHRDLRSFTDLGRWYPIVSLQFHEDLHMAFSRMILEAMRTR